jgi:hypothetical protein
MPDLIGLSKAMNSASYVTPRIGISAGGSAPSDVLTSNDPQVAQRQLEMTRSLFNTADADMPGPVKLGRLLTASGVDMVDMFGSALPGVDRGDIWRTARELGLNDVADYAARNPTSVGLTSGIVGGLLTGYATDAYLIPAMGRSLLASTTLSNTKLVQSGYKFLNGAKMAAINSAESAAISGEMATVWGTTGGRALLSARVAEGVGKAAINEAAVAATTHTNQQIWSDDASTNLMFAALGIGFGGVTGVLGARFEARQIANSDEILRLRAASSDPWGNVALREIQPSAEELRRLGPGAQYKESVNVTGLALTARQKIPADLPVKRQELIRNEATQAESQMQESLLKITSRGVEGAPGSSFGRSSDLDKPAFKHATDTLHNDPTSMVGLDSLGSGNFTANVKNREKYIDELKKNPDDIDSMRKAAELENQETMGLVNQSWMPDDKQGNLRRVSEYNPKDLKATPRRMGGGLEYEVTLSGGKKINVNAGGLLTGPAAPNFATFRIDDQLRVYDVLNRQMSGMLAKSETLTLSQKPTWLQLDMAVEYARRGGKVDFTTHSAGQFKTLEDLQVASLKAKTETAIKLAQKGEFDFWARAKLNLPLPSSLERIHDGTSVAMADLLNGLKKNPNMTLQELKDFRKKSLAMSNLRDGLKETDPALDGNMFNFNKNKDGVWQPVLTGNFSFVRTVPELRGTREQLMLDTVENKAWRYQKLKQGNLTKEMIDRLSNEPAFQGSMNLRHLADDQVTGLGSEFAQATGAALTKSMRERDSITMQGASQVRQIVNRVKEDFTNRFFKNIFQGKQNILAALPNRGSKALVDQYFSFAGGWDLKRGFTQLDNGHFGLVLADTPRNARRLGRDVGDGEFLTSPLTGKPIAVDAAGVDFIERFQIAAKQLLRDANAVRLSRGLTPLESKAHYVPPPDTKGKIIGFTVGVDGKTVPGGAVVASNLDEFNRLADIQRSRLEPGQRFFTKAQLESTADLWDQAEMGWVDPGFLGAKKEGQTGSIFGSTMNPNGMEDALKWVKDRIDSIADGAVRSLYDQQLAIARARAEAQATLEGGSNVARRNIWDEYDATIRGVPLSSVKPDRLTAAVGKLDAPIQAVIDTGWPLVKVLGANRVSQWVSDVGQRLGMKNVGGFKSFEDLANKLGPHTPYATVAQWAESNIKASPPPEFRAIASKLNSLTASMLLRWFEIPNAAMNMLGVITNMPSILRSPNTPLMGQLVASNGKKVGVVDSYKILAGGFADMLSKEKARDWEIMARNGDTNQSFMELHKQLALVDSRGTWGKVFLGDPAADTSTFSGKIKAKGVDGMISLATDTTESLSRAWSHFIGLRLADLNGITGTEARHDFARQVANQAIANYNPLNKPELFQSSLGSMFGLFTSYMQQYNQRLFRWMETKDYASVGRQLALQSTLFGVTSVPGYNALEWFFQGTQPNPDATLTDAIYAKYGPRVGAVIAHGGVSEVGKLFGLDNGIALYSRGDANFRAPTIDPTRLMASMNMLSQVVDTVWEVGNKAFNPDEDFSIRAVAEIVAKNAPNRAMKGALQVLTGDGLELDQNGLIVSDTKDAFETSLRMMGLRSTRQQGEIEAYYANAAQRRRMASRMDTLREETRLQIRSGNQLEPMELFNKYVKNGGSPAHFTTWIQDVMRSQQDTRGMNDFVKSLRSEGSQLEAWRYDVRQ